jgi:hypothetical protein
MLGMILYTIKNQDWHVRCSCALAFLSPGVSMDNVVDVADTVDIGSSDGGTDGAGAGIGPAAFVPSAKSC